MSRLKLNLRTRKVLYDVWSNKSRTVLVVLTILIGVFALGTIARSWAILSRELTNNYLAINPASGTLTTRLLFYDDVVDIIENMPEVQVAEGRHRMQTRFKVGNDWYTLILMTLDDYDDIQINKMRLERGAWPPPKQTILLERSSVELIGQSLGAADVIDYEAVIEMENGRQHQLKISGLVYDLTQFPSNIANVVFGYTTPETLESLNGIEGHNQLYFTVAENRLDKSHIQQITQQVRDKMELIGLTIVRQEVPVPGQHPLNNIIQSLLLILGVLGVFSIFLSGFLIVNMISALLAQQIKQIGILKAIGGERNHIVLMYMGMIAIFGLLALLISMPASIFGARALTSFLGSLLNFDMTNFSTPAYLIGLDIFASMVVPLAITLLPIIKGTRITVREAIGSDAQAVMFGASRIDQILNWVRGIPIALAYALRNIFRHKVRLIFTLLPLALAGTIFISVVTLRTSMLNTLETVAAYWQQDIRIGFQNVQRLAKIERVALAVPGVSYVEGRLGKNGVRIRPDNSLSSQAIQIFGVTPNSAFLTPTLIEGRWLQPEDSNAIVINVDFLAEEPDLEIGSEITLEIANRKQQWQVVGIVTSQLVGGGGLMKPIAYVSYPYFAKVVGKVGEVSEILVKTEDAGDSVEVAKALEDEFRRAGQRTRITELNAQMRSAMQSAAGILLALVLIMTILFAVVGGLGLTGMMSLSVLERTKELSVVRAIGGTNDTVLQIVLTEGLFVGLLSWLFGAILSIPVSQYLATIVGLAFQRFPLTHSFSFSGILFWLVVVLILAAAASFLPAYQAAQMSVREALAYE